MSKAQKLLSALRGTVRDTMSRAGDPEFSHLLRTSLDIVPAALKDAGPWLLRAREGRDESLLRLVQRHATATPHALAVEMGDEQLSWSDLDRRSSSVAHVLSETGVGKGDVVALSGTNSPSYLAIILGISRVGAVAALINSNLEGAPLSHAIRSAGARVVIVEAALGHRLEARDDLRDQIDHVLRYGDGELDEQIAKAPSRLFPRVPINAADDFVYIYTSGTTGLPKPCRVSHARCVIAGAGFGTLMFRFRPGDKLYSVLPLYHSSALMIGAGSCFVTGTPLALRDQFSARAFWPDVQRYGATAMLYIGELCRYLANTPPCEEERHNTLRVAVGNGLRADVWEPFAERFDIADIREFYSATEAPGVIFNLTGKVGSVGHVPLRRFGSMKLARYDVENDELVRDQDGRCIECGPDEVGQLVIELKPKARSAIDDFRGYTDAEASKKKLLHDVFEPGDRYFLSGDLLRFDRNDYFYFVDRIGDTYRWKGENVSTSEVAEVLSNAPGLHGATVSSVQIPGNEGRAGLAAVVCDGDFDAEGFWRAAQELPAYAQPRFVRVLSQFSTTGTFKIQKSELRHDGVDPDRVKDALYLRQGDGYVPLTPELFTQVVAQEIRL